MSSLVRHKYDKRVMLAKKLRAQECDEAPTEDSSSSRAHAGISITSRIWGSSNLRRGRIPSFGGLVDDDDLEHGEFIFRINGRNPGSFQRCMEVGGVCLAPGTSVLYGTVGDGSMRYLPTAERHRFRGTAQRANKRL